MANMTFQVRLDRGITRHVTHINGNDADGLILYTCEYNEKDEVIKSKIQISVDEFKRNNARLFADMNSRKEKSNARRN